MTQKMRRTDPSKEMAYMVLIDKEIEWCDSRATADKIAADALKDADDNDYTVSVFVLHCLAQNGVAP